MNTNPPAASCANGAVRMLLKIAGFTLFALTHPGAWSLEANPCFSYCLQCSPASLSARSGTDPNE